MPSSSTVQAVTNRQPISTSFQTPHSFRPPQVLITPLAIEACGEELTGMAASNYASATYPGSSLVLAYPFEIADDFLVQKVFWLNGTTAGTDSADCGVYSEDGATLIVHGGSTLTATGSVVQEIDCTDTLLVGPGRYWCAYVQSGVTNTPMMSAAAIALVRSMGWVQMAGSGSTLGSTLTPAAITAANVPLCGVAGRVKAA